MNDTNIHAAVVVIFKPLSFAVVFSTCQVTLAVFLAITITFARNKLNMMGKKMMEMAEVMMLMLMSTFVNTTRKLGGALAAVRRLATLRLLKIYKCYNDISGNLILF